MSKDIELNQLSDFLKERTSTVNGKLEIAIKACVEKVRSDIRYDMAHTPLDMSKSYFTENKTKAHHPSLPGNPPAPDSGNLRNSINFEVHNDGKTVYGVVGSIQREADYAVYTEYGTTKMAPRPWLKPAMLKNDAFIKKSIAEAIKNTLTGENK